MKTIEDLLPMVAHLARERAPKTTVPYDDLYQEGCLALVEAYGRYEDQGASVSTFCHKRVFWAIHDAAYPNRKKKDRNGEQVPNDVLLSDVLQVGEHTDFATVDEIDEYEVRVEGRLSGKQLEVMQFKRLGKSNVEIAQHFGITRQAVKSLLNRAYEKTRGS